MIVGNDPIDSSQKFLKFVDPSARNNEATRLASNNGHVVVVKPLLNDYITSFSSNLEIGHDARLLFHLTQVADRVTHMGILAGKSPTTVVPSCLYLVSCLTNDPISASCLKMMKR